ncbi:MAG: 50S ribosomal protein L11 methyltransferase [Verrucomicrobiae bacterium]|nr:50S ribosomal protein L11 methyltransferase [Verrucomicrobiae bacterium]
MNRYTVVLVPAADADVWTERIAEQPGILGIQELPADGTEMFRPDTAHHFVRFDQKREFFDWLRRETWRRSDAIRLKIWHTGSLSLPGDLPIVESGTESHRDYTRVTRRFHRGRCIGPFWVGPPWREPRAEKIPILIEPGSAFGLGDHPTTQMCLTMLTAHRRARDVLDFGAGTGILALAARRWFGHCRLHLVEPDRQSAREIRHNFKLNHITPPRRIHSSLPAGAFDLVLANVYLDALCHLLAALTHGIRSRLRPGGYLIVSGLLGADQRDEFISFASARGWRVTRQRHRADWFALELVQATTP